MPGAVGQPQVEEHGRRPVLGEEAQALADGGGGQRPVAAGVEQLDAGLADRVVVVDDEGGREAPWASSMASRMLSSASEGGSRWPACVQQRCLRGSARRWRAARPGVRRAGRSPATPSSSRAAPRTRPPVNPPGTWCRSPSSTGSPTECVDAAHRAARTTWSSSASWMQPGEEFFLTQATRARYVWRGTALRVPVNFPPRGDRRTSVRIYDPHIVGGPTEGITADRLKVGGEALTRVRLARATPTSRGSSTSTRTARAATPF